MAAIQQKLTDEERTIWKKIYLLYDEYHDCKWTDSDWLRYAKQIGELSAELWEHELSTQLIIGITEYFSGISKRMRTEIRAEQLTLEV